jgi:hypothetical protein
VKDSPLLLTVKEAAAQVITNEDGLADYCLCTLQKPTAELRMQVVQRSTGQVLPFASRKQPNRIRPERTEQFNLARRPFRQWERTGSVTRLPITHHRKATGDVYLHQPHTFLRPESEIQHQNSGLPQGVFGGGKVLRFEFRRMIVSRLPSPYSRREILTTFQESIHEKRISSSPNGYARDFQMLQGS